MKHLILSIALFFSAMGVMAQAEFEEGCQFYNQKQYSKAVAIFQKYADEGLAQGQFNLAICYEKGNGVPKDYAKAAYWYEKAANQGDATAQSIIGDFYYDGTGVTQNYQKAYTGMKRRPTKAMPAHKPIWAIAILKVRL